MIKITMNNGFVYNLAHNSDEQSNYASLVGSIGMDIKFIIPLGSGLLEDSMKLLDGASVECIDIKSVELVDD